jgi:hypothetical protein
MTQEQIIEQQQEIKRALLLSERNGQTAVRWVRIRAKALWLAFKAWQVTRELRASRLRVLEQHAKNEEGLRK